MKLLQSEQKYNPQYKTTILATDVKCVYLIVSTIFYIKKSVIGYAACFFLSPQD